MRSERWLTRRAACGDREAFAAIFRRHQQDLYRYCVAILGDPDDAQDALQNTMVKALRALPGERREIALKPWLFRIAHNESIELRRRARPTESLADVELPAATSLEQIAAERGRLRELLNDLAALPERQRGALVMRELAGLDFAAIGDALETTPASARQVLYEARQGLREMGEGRDMRCDAVTAILSDGDGRVARRRDVRAHLRSCPDCMAFAEEIQSRGEALAAIAPLPALAAAGLLKTALASSAGGATAAGAGAAATGAKAGAGAAAGAGAGVGGSTGAGGIGLAAVAAKAGSTATLVKSALGVVSIVAVGAVAADRTHLVHFGGSGGGAPATKSTGAEGEDPAASPAAHADRKRSLRVSDSRVTFQGGRGLDGARPTRRGTGVAAADTTGARPEVTEEATNHPSVGLVDEAGDTEEPSAEGESPSPGAESSASGAGTFHPEHPAHPAHPTHPSGPSEGARPSHPDHPAKPPHPEHPATPAGESGADPTKPAKEPKVEEPTPSADPPAEPPGAEGEAPPAEAAPGKGAKATPEEEPTG